MIRDNKTMNHPTLLDEGIRRLISATTTVEVYETIVETLKQEFDADRCSLAIADDTESEFVIEPRSARGESSTPDTIPIGQDIPSQCYLKDQPCLIDDLMAVRSAAATDADHQQKSQCRSLLCVPLKDRGVFIASSASPETFTENELQIAKRFVSYAGSALTTLEPSSSKEGCRDQEENPLDTAASILSHDVQSPLNVVQGRLELAEATGDFEHLENAKVALGRLEELINGVVMLLRTGQHVQEPETIPLEDAVGKAQSGLEMSEATLILEDTIPILADENCLLEILENLFKNAVEHAGPNVTIRVGTLDDGFYIEDDGPGIPKKERQRVFGWGVSSSEAHTGLGLSIVKRLVEAHGWDITLTEGSAGGTRFEITIPESEGINSGKILSINNKNTHDSEQ